LCFYAGGLSVCKDRVQSGLVAAEGAPVGAKMVHCTEMRGAVVRSVCVRSVRGKADGEPMYASLFCIACLHACLNRLEDLENA
jgi:hypothetical protein